MSLFSFDSIQPKIHASCFVAPQACVIGDVEIGEGSSIWFQTVVRGDVNTIRIGKKTNIQDLCMVHVTNRDAPKPAPTVIGDEVTVGHRVVLHGCTIKDRCLIGIGSIILDGAVIEEECMIGAGSLVTPGTIIPRGHLAWGSPAKVTRPLTAAEKKFLRLSAAHYAQLAKKYGEEGDRKS
ncbi:MAG TPA: gamma carbonic anhydrase family protein [Deltaproteobacteria bacterium]|nr:MAG: gamma carbonic anhydrase family protein [Deltaproteobacteria bacterium GWA2_45_12]HBF12191.1 gamma carbonic anhydrase family protein [Deltaproteobacteria bacterium]